MPLDEAKRVKIPALSVQEIEAAKTEGPPSAQLVKVTPPRMKTAVVRIIGISPYVQHAFSEKQRKIMEETQRQGQQARGKKKREPKDFQAIYEAAKHVSTEGWIGIPAPAFRNAMISACKLVGIVMTRAKLSIFVIADGVDAQGNPLVRITKGEPHIHEAPVRNESGVADVRWRPMWDAGWKATVTLRWDLDQFSADDVANLMLRAGLQVGVGEGRADSPNSNGLGWGAFELDE